MDVEATAFVDVFLSMDLGRTDVDPDPDPDALVFVDEAVLTGRAAELEAVGVRAGVGWGRSIPTRGCRAGAAGCAGAGAGLRAGVGGGARTGARTGTRFTGGGGTTTGTARRAGASRRTPSCASTLSSAATINRRSSHCGHRHVFHRA